MMRWIFGIIILAGLTAFFLRVLESMSTDAVAMGLGVLFGVFASIPVILLFLAFQRNQSSQPRVQQREPREAGGQRPMIVMLPREAQAPQQQPSQQWAVSAAPPPPRLLTTSKQSDDTQPGTFRVIGEPGEDW